MTRPPAVRRKQFSSCDSCRNSHVACDALTVVNVEDISSSRESCSRCTKQDTRCTFNVRIPTRYVVRIRANRHQLQWVQRHKSKHVKNRHFSDRGTSVTQIDQAIRPMQFIGDRRMSVDHGLYSNTRLIHGTLWEIYHQNFEAMLGTWIGVCPYLDGYDMSAFRCDGNSEPLYGAAVGDTYLKTISITRLYVTLDKSVAQGRYASDSTANNSIKAPTVDSEKGDQLDLSLVKAIHSFSARWLYLGDISRSKRPQHPYYDSITRQFWRIARKDMLKVINIISYRSVLTLVIFGLTPIPTGLSKDGEADGLTGQICMRLGLEMLHQLRVQVSIPQFYNSKVVRSIKDDWLNAMAKDSYREEFISIESAAYAAAMIFDNDPALIEDCRFTLSSGLPGSCRTV